MSLSDESDRTRPRFALLPRITTGKDLASVVGNAWAYRFENDEPATVGEARVIGRFLQDLHDWGDIWSNLDHGQRLEAQFSMADTIREVEASGFLVFGVR